MLPLDLALFHAINADTATAPFVIDSARWVSAQVPYVMAGVLLALVAAGSAAQRRAVLIALASMASAWVMVQLLRHAIAAPRPAQLGIGHQWIEHAARAGFPSMHTAAAFALAAGLALGGLRTVAMPAGLVAFAMAWSRVSLGVHFPSDVAAGALAGVIAAYSVHWAVVLRVRRRAAPWVTPLPVSAVKPD